VLAKKPAAYPQRMGNGLSGWRAVKPTVILDREGALVLKRLPVVDGCGLPVDNSLGHMSVQDLTSARFCRRPAYTGEASRASLAGLEQAALVVQAVRQMPAIVTDRYGHLSEVQGADRRFGIAI
jgi:hypothetical protein